MATAAPEVSADLCSGALTQVRTRLPGRALALANGAPPSWRSGIQGQRRGLCLIPYGHTVVGRLRTVASQEMEPVVTPSTVARVPNLRSTLVPLSTMLDGFERSETEDNL